MKSPCGVVPPWLSEMASTESFLQNLQLSALMPRLFEGRKLPDAAVLQQWLNVLITAPFWSVSQAATDTVAVFLNSTAFTVLRDEYSNQERHKNYTCPKQKWWAWDDSSLVGVETNEDEEFGQPFKLKLVLDKPKNKKTKKKKTKTHHWKVSYFLISKCSLTVMGNSNKAWCLEYNGGQLITALSNIFRQLNQLCKHNYLSLILPCDQRSCSLYT